MEKVLLAIDGSPSSDHAAEALVKQCRSGAQLDVRLLNVQPPLPALAAGYVDPELFDQDKDAQGAAALAGARRRLDEAGIPYHAHVAVGYPAQVIVDYARSAGCDRIVMGNQKRGLLAGILLGSTAAEVVHAAHIPVEVIPTAAPARRGNRNGSRQEETPCI